jgi:hypothetical protein
VDLLLDDCSNTKSIGRCLQLLEQDLQCVVCTNPPRTYLSCTSEHATPTSSQFLATSFQYCIPTSSETFDLIVHVRSQLYEFDCTAIDLMMSTEMLYCCTVEVSCKEFCVDLLEVSVARSIVMEGSDDIKELLTLK